MWSCEVVVEQGILLDPSCSGSGIVGREERMDAKSKVVLFLTVHLSSSAMSINLY